MQYLIDTKARLRPTLAGLLSKDQLGAKLYILIPAGLWLMLWLSISPGNPKDILSPGSPAAFAHGLRAVFPLIAAGVAASIIGLNVIKGSPRPFRFFGPLGLTAAYGLTGFAASLKSPDASSALWWSVLYLSVPVVLWSSTWRADPLEQLRRLINVTWFGLILVSIGLFFVAVFRLELADKLLDPSRYLECSASGWIDITGRRLRETGVGRYAAIAGIIAIGSLCQGRWRPMWSVVLLLSFSLLLSTGARGSLVGFGAGASLILLTYSLHATRKTLVAGLLITIVLASALWGTGTLNTFAYNCLSIGHPDRPETPSLVPAVPVAAGQTIPSPVPAVPVAAAQTIRPETPSDGFFQFTGRTAVWKRGWEDVKSSPLLGYGFNADRLLYGTHMHNAVMHSLIQAGFVGAIPFISAGILAWFLFFRIVRRLKLIPSVHKCLVIQCGGVLAFLTMRSFPESTGAFFGIDWLVLALVMLYLQVVNYGNQPIEVNGDHDRLA